MYTSHKCCRQGWNPRGNCKLPTAVSGATAVSWTRSPCKRVLASVAGGSDGADGTTAVDPTAPQVCSASLGLFVALFMSLTALQTVLKWWRHYTKFCTRLDQSWATTLRLMKLSAPSAAPCPTETDHALGTILQPASLRCSFTK